MNPHELRLGNYILGISNTPEVIELITKDEVDTDKHDALPINQIEPIELTEVWLKKLGFKENSFSHVWENKRIGVFDCEIVKIVNSDIEFLIKYVHQLQNLFYFIEGEELTVSS